MLPAAIVALMVAFLGQARSAVFRSHMDKVDQYLADAERQLSGNVGWTNYYRGNVETEASKRQMGTRIVLWHVLRFIAFVHVLFQLLAALFPELAFVKSG